MIARRRWLLSLMIATPALAAAIDPWASHRNANGLLPAESAFDLLGVTREGDTLRVDWSIAPGYYLYRRRLAFTALPSGRPIEAVALPPGETEQDAHFGQVVIYRGPLSAQLSVPRGTALPKRLRVRFQGCADAGVCYPPVTRDVDVLSP